MPAAFITGGTCVLEAVFPVSCCGTLLFHVNSFLIGHFCHQTRFITRVQVEACPAEIRMCSVHDMAPLCGGV